MILMTVLFTLLDHVFIEASKKASTLREELKYI